VFEVYVAEHGLSDRLRFVSGDVLADPVPPADVVILGAVLHIWGPDDQRLVLRKVHDALPPGGAVIVREQFIDDDRTAAPGLLMSLTMLLNTDAGRNFTVAECQQWLREEGFRDFSVAPLDGPNSAVIALK